MQEEQRLTCTNWLSTPLLPRLLLDQLINSHRDAIQNVDWQVANGPEKVYFSRINDKREGCQRETEKTHVSYKALEIQSHWPVIWRTWLHCHAHGTRHHWRDKDCAPENAVESNLRGKGILWRSTLWALIVWPLFLNGHLHRSGNVDKPSNWVTYFNQPPLFECVWIKERTSKRHHVLIRDWTTCSKFITYSRLKSQTGRGPIWILKRTRIFTFIMIIWATVSTYAGLSIDIDSNWLLLLHFSKKIGTIYPRLAYPSTLTAIDCYFIAQSKISTICFRLPSRSTLRAIDCYSFIFQGKKGVTLSSLLTWLCPDPRNEAMLAKTSGAPFPRGRRDTPATVGGRRNRSESFSKEQQK